MAATLVTITMLITAFVNPYVTGSSVPYNPTADGTLRFDETASLEIGIENEHKEISCIAQNFCFITWEKNELPIDENLQKKLINKQQTLRFTQINETDTGNYTCKACNCEKTRCIQQTIKLMVIKDCKTNTIKPIHLESPGCQNASASIGSNFTFTCEFFIGYHKEDAYQDWFKYNESMGVMNSTIDDDKSWPDLNLFGFQTLRLASCFTRLENTTKCGSNPIFRVNLQIGNISGKHYGTYALNINHNSLDTVIYLTLSPVPPTPDLFLDPKEVNRIFIGPVMCVSLLICCVSIGYRFRTDIKLRYKDSCTTTKEDSRKINDVYLSYDWNSTTDRCFARNLVRYLEDRGYRVFWEINCLPGGDREEDILTALETSWRSVIVFSPDYLASHRNFDVIFSMDQAKHYKKEIIPIIYRDISMVTEENQNALVRQILSSHCLHFDRITSKPQSVVKKIVHNILGDSQSEKSLLKELRLRLPPPNKTSRIPSSSGNTTNSVFTELSSREIRENYVQIETIVLPECPEQVVSNGVHDSNKTRLYPSLSEFTNAINI